MKKPKLSLGPDGMKGLFIQHVEKMVFGLAILAVAVFVYLGFSLKSDLGRETPPQLKTQAANAVSHIEQSTFEKVREERKPREGKGGQYFVRVDKLGELDPSVYETAIPWKTPLGDSRKKREDPEVFAPIQLETAAFTGPMCLTNEDNEESLLASLENAPRKVVKKREKRKRGSYSDRGYGEGGEGEQDSGPGYGEGDEYGDPYGGGSRRGRDKGAKKPEGPPRKYDPSKICGYRPGGTASSSYYGGDSYGEGYGEGEGSDYGSSYGSSGPARGGLPLATSKQVIAVKALAPFRKQADEFKRVLGDAVGYDPNRDRPRLIFFQAQRADVTDDPDKELTDADWKDIMTPKTAVTIAKKENWHGVLPEVADRRYTDPNVTMPAPPIMVRCLDDALLHSEVPKTSRLPQLTKPEEDEAEETEETEMDESLPGGMSAPGGRGGFASGFPGAGSSSYGSGYGSEYGSGYGSGYGYGGGEGDYESEYGGGEYGSEYGSGYGYGSEYGSGYGYGSSGMRAPEPAQYKLVRFFDTNVQMGRKYRYRIRLFIEDPNNPNTDPRNGFVSAPPRRRTLSMEVIDRLKKQEAASGENSPYYVITDWSDASQPVSLPSTSRAFVSTVASAGFSSGAGGVQILEREPKGDVVSVVWNDALAIDVSKKHTAYRGSVLNASGQFEVLDPVTLEIKLLKDFKLDSRITVLDLFGGEDLPGDRENKVTSVGEYLMLDDRGNFIVHHELEDYDRFRRFALADEEKTGFTSDYGGSYGEGEGEYGGGGVPGRPSMER